jgi:hypothetical protein
VLELSFRNEVWYWRGPAPFYFVTVPEPQCRDLREVSKEVSYGWGMIPAIATVGESSSYTALWPKDGGYVVPVKAWVRKAENLDDGVVVGVHLVVGRRDQLTDKPAL